jgi:hypothetical protein
MKTVKQQAAMATAVGLKQFVSYRPCRYGHRERDGRGTCIACSRQLRLEDISPIACAPRSVRALAFVFASSSLAQAVHHSQRRT